MLWSSSLFVSAFVFLGAASAQYRNPTLAPFQESFEAGKVVPIQWEGGESGTINLELVNDSPDVLRYPIQIAKGIRTADRRFDWSIPASLKSAPGYHVRAWGVIPPATPDDPGMGNSFAIQNNIPGAVTAFTVKPVNCAIGQACTIEWDFPAESSMYPHHVDVNLYKVGTPYPIANIGTVPATQKSITWNVPSDTTLLDGQVFFSVTGEGMPSLTPGTSNAMGANGVAFQLHSDLPAANSDDEEDEDDESDDDETKTDSSKISGMAKKDSNAATSVSAGAFAFVASLALIVPFAFLL